MWNVEEKMKAKLKETENRKNGVSRGWGRVGGSKERWLKVANLQL